MTDSAPIADTSDLDSAHYLRAVADMAGHSNVTAHDAIYSHNGIKLVEKGTRIDSRLYERLIEHKLREPIDTQLTVDGAVDVPSLVAMAESMVQERALPRILAAQLKTPAQLTAPLRRLPLSLQMAFKLTVLRDQQPDLFEHSVEMALVSLYLGLRSGLDESACVSLAAAAVLHDIGTLHMDPAWRDPKRRITGAERRHLIAHPVTSMLLIRDQNLYPPSVETAVLEHHESMDGSGYPRGLKGPDISRLGRILLLAEVVSALFEKYEDNAAQRLTLILRLYHHKFDSALVGYLMPALQAEAERSGPLTLKVEMRHFSEVLAGAFAKWAELKAAVPEAELDARVDGPASLMEMRLLALSRSLAEAGSHPDQQVYLGGDGATDTGADDSEASLTLQESMWELRGIHNICQRRWPDLAQRTDAAAGAAAGWCAWLESVTNV